MRINFRLALSISSTIASPLMLWKGLSIATNTESPIVVVLSGSMEPAFSRGDILFLTNPLPTEYIKTGDIVVYKVPGADIPIVHRVIEIHDATPHEERSDSGLQTLNPGTIPINQKILTKGDNNPVDDLTLYGGMEWLERKHIVGTVKGFLPYVGFASIWLNELRHSLFGSIS